MIQSYEKAIAHAKALCSKAEYAPIDIAKKLSAWGISQKNSEKIIKMLLLEKFLSPKRYTRAYVHDALTLKHFGLKKIRFKLMLKEIPESLIESAIEELYDEEEYFNALLNIMRKKTKNMPRPFSVEDQRKAVSAATSMGYEAEMCFKVIRMLQNEQEECL